MKGTLFRDQPPTLLYRYCFCTANISTMAYMLMRQSATLQDLMRRLQRNLQYVKAIQAIMAPPTRKSHGAWWHLLETLVDLVCYTQVR